MLPELKQEPTKKPSSPRIYPSVTRPSVWVP